MNEPMLFLKNPLIPRQNKICKQIVTVLIKFEIGLAGYVFTLLKIYGVLYNQSSSIAFDGISSYWSAPKSFWFLGFSLVTTQ